MKQCSVKAAALGLSTITLASTVTFPVHAQAPDESESLVLVPEENIESQQVNPEHEAVSATEEVAQTVDSLEVVDNAVTEEVLLDIQETVEATENIEKAKESMDEAEADATEASEDAVTITQEAVSVTEEAASVAEDAAITVSDENTTKEEAKTIIADVEATVEQAEADFDTATETYNHKLEEYQAAKEDYETAVAAYNSNKNKAIEDLTKASESLDEAQAKLTVLEQQLEEAIAAMVDSGADVLLAADDNKESDVSAYVAAIVQYYYAPKQLKENEFITDFKVISTAGDYVTISYTVMNENGTEERSVTADYGYEVDTSTGEVSIYDNKLVYTYIDASGNTVEISKEEAEKLSDGLIAIDSYWTATGFYIPLYSSDYKYKGTIRKAGYSDSKAIAQGSDAAKKAYGDNKKYYNVTPIFMIGYRYDRTGWDEYELDLDYKVTYDKVVYESFKISKETPSFEEFVASKNASGAIVISSKEEYSRGIIRYIDGYEVSEAVKSGKYESYMEAVRAINAEALKRSGVVGVDYTNSEGLNISEQIDYAVANKAYKEMLTSFNQEYRSYISNLKATLESYSEMLKQVSDAKEEYAAASEKVNNLKQQISQLDAANDIDTAAKFAKLSAELEKAEINYQQAKENLESAKASLAEAKATFETRFDVAEKATLETGFNVAEDNGSGSQAESSYITLLPEVIPEEEVLLELEELMRIEPDEIRLGSSSGGSSASPSEEATEEPVEEIKIEEPAEEVVIPDEEAPLGVTIAGLLARGKWFIGLAGVSTAGIGVVVIEEKRRAAIKIIDKLSQ